MVQANMDFRVLISPINVSVSVVKEETVLQLCICSDIYIADDDTQNPLRGRQDSLMGHPPPPHSPYRKTIVLVCGLSRLFCVYCLTQHSHLGNTTHPCSAITSRAPQQRSSRYNIQYSRTLIVKTYKNGIITAPTGTH
jgi:hypothetical protein